MKSMAKIHEMIQNRATLTESIRALMKKYEDGTEMTAEDKASLAKMEGDFDKANAQILAEQKQLDRERIVGEKSKEAVDAGDPKKAELMNAFRAHLVQGSAQSEGVEAPAFRAPRHPAFISFICIGPVQALAPWLGRVIRQALGLSASGGQPHRRLPRARGVVW
jgi:hypothetical protein